MTVPIDPRNNLPAYPALTGGTVVRMRNLSTTLDQATDRVQIALDAAVEQFGEVFAKEDARAAVQARISTLGRRPRQK